MGNRPVPIHAGNPGPLTGPGNNTWLIDGAEPALIDAGVGIATHVEALAAHLGSRALARVLVTHGHQDHASGMPALAERWPELIPAKFTLPGESGWQALAEGDTVETGSVTLTVLHTPGHAPDHVCFWDDETGSLYSGDMVISGTTVMIPAGGGGSLRAYLQSLERLAALEPHRIYPGHGPVIERPVELIREYIAHRMLRERQVLACLADGITEVEAMVARIYGTLAPPIFRAARQTVEAHLEKIKEDENGAWR
ncbi:MAG TPA: MBL fold metallo-hydrolase [Vicinamibacterales bacterium]|nr:MBL fold metallo-hydrolase [Vicinamibacterales bacterium]